MELSVAAKLIAIPTASILSGYNIAFSQNGTPNLLGLHASISTQVFAKVYYSGLALVTPGAVSSTAAFGYLAYVHPEKRNLYLAGAALVLGVGLFTALVMKPGIGRLIEISKDAALQAKAEQSGEAERLLNAWVSQNYLRAFPSFAGGMTGLYAALLRL